jgi:predicted GIY-YIG superfamily endonuclease
VTNDIVRRVHEHKTKAIAGFSRKYSVDKLVWSEIYDDPVTAITREKELKKWRRDWKIRLIEKAESAVDRLVSTNRRLAARRDGFRARAARAPE